jgi:hypothetical protein
VRGCFFERGEYSDSNAQKALGALAVAGGDIRRSPSAHGSLRSPFAIAVLAP